MLAVQGGRKLKRLQLRHTICSSHCWLLATQLLGPNRPNRHVRPLKVMFCLRSPVDAAWWVWHRHGHGHGQGWTAQSKRFWQLSRSWCLLLTLVCDRRRSLDVCVGFRHRHRHKAQAQEARPCHGPAWLCRLIEWPLV